MFDKNDKTIKLTLMYKNEKVLSFGVKIIYFDMYMCDEIEVHNSELLPVFMKNNLHLAD